MRDWWYGDKRDIVKWAAIPVLAKQHGMHTVMQIALYRRDELKYELRINETATPLPDEVIKHFRDLDDIQRLAKNVGLRIEVHKEIFESALVTLMKLPGRSDGMPSLLSYFWTRTRRLHPRPMGTSM